MEFTSNECKIKTWNGKQWEYELELEYDKHIILKIFVVSIKNRKA